MMHVENISNYYGFFQFCFEHGFLTKRIFMKSLQSLSDLLLICIELYRGFTFLEHPAVMLRLFFISKKYTTIYILPYFLVYGKPLCTHVQIFTHSL